MDKPDAEKLITEYARSIFGFTLKRCKSPEDAEDLAQEIILRAFRALLRRDDLADPSRFIWTIAHNALSNYYRDGAKSVVGIPLDEAAELLADPRAETEDENADAVRRLQGEIAYLSKLQRRIVVAYYFENRRQADIAQELNIPLGTVKWHLFEAKKELKRGMETMRTTSELKFNPIRFDRYGINGSAGTKNPDEFFRSALSQNICYCIRREPKTVNEIADALGVSPVYVESEVEFLEKYSFLLKQGGRYIANFIIDEPTAELLILQNSMYKSAAELFANELYDELSGSGLLDSPELLCAQTDTALTQTAAPQKDRNFLLWALIPFLAAWSGEELLDQRISFEDVSTLRADGGHNIFQASVLPEGLKLPDDLVPMKNWCGPMWNASRGQMLWQVDSEWSDRPNPIERNVPDEYARVIPLYHSEKEHPLPAHDYAWLAERGYIKTVGQGVGRKPEWQIVIIEDPAYLEKLLALGSGIKKKYRSDFAALAKPYREASLAALPPHMRRLKEFELQFLFHSDGRFLCHCITELLHSGKLKPPTGPQRKALTTLLLPALP